MRSRLIVFAFAAFTVACSDAPIAPLLQPLEASFGEYDDNPPPPWAVVGGSGATETEAVFSYTANFLVNPPGNVAWLHFTGGENVKFSGGARLLSVNGNLKGVGTLTVGGTTYQLSSVATFEFNASCTTNTTIRTNTTDTSNRAASCASFSGEGFRSEGSFWTGRLANDGRYKFGKPGDGDVCTVETCDISFTDSKGRGR
ncbi:MAG: hypothetical protein H0X11_09545 [Betaproteobacteria bacterium]|nr:hypothetical protein [Betaproteobacteria bacterium]